MIKVKQEDDNAQDGAVPKVRKRKKRASIWTHYNHNVEKDRMHCRYCNKDYSNTSTQPLKYHIQKEHPHVDVNAPALSKLKSSVISNSFKVFRMNTTPILKGKKKEKAQLKLLEFIIKDSRPINIVTGEGFKGFIQDRDPSFPMPSRAKLRKMLTMMKEIAVGQLKSVFETDVKDTCSLTFDAWSSIAACAFLGVTMHWVGKKKDGSKKLKTITLVCDRFKGRHTAVNIKKKLETIITRFGLEGKVFAATLDTAANGMRAAKAMEKEGVVSENFPCMNHVLNLVFVFFRG